MAGILLIMKIRHRLQRRISVYVRWEVFFPSTLVFPSREKITLQYQFDWIKYDLNIFAVSSISKTLNIFWYLRAVNDVIWTLAKSTAWLVFSRDIFTRLPFAKCLWKFGTRYFPKFSRWTTVVIRINETLRCFAGHLLTSKPWPAADHENEANIWSANWKKGSHFL